MDEPEDVPADVKLACVMCPELFTPAAAEISPEAMATVRNSAGARTWFALCPGCSEFLRSRA